MFSHQERNMYEENYNPPVGRYDVDLPRNSKILDFSKTPSRDISLHRQKTPPKTLSKFCSASPQLSGYAKPGYRYQIEKKHKTNRLNKSAQLEPQISVTVVDKSVSSNRGKIIKNTTTKRVQEESDDSQISEVNGYSIFENEIECQIRCKSKQVKRKPFNHKNIFSLYPVDSLELAQQREKMKSKPVPPPGYYYNEQQSSSIKPIFTPWKFQCFQSTVRRFNQLQNDETPCVGQYNVVNKLRPIGVVPIDKQLSRREKLIDTPGVGTYNVESINRKRAFSQQSVFPSPFGSSSRRF